MPALPTETSTTTTTDKVAEAIKFGRKTRWNPLRFFSGEALGRALDSFESGDLREAAQFFKVIAERDDTISGVKSKREKAVAHKPFNVVTLDDSPEAQKQREVLEGFWRRAKWVDAWDRSQKGKLPRLIKAMQEAVSYKYSVHHIVWQPNARGELSATFEHVPLWFFENREAEMRFLASGFGIAGEPMAESDWLISTGDALMIACSIGYAAKRLSMMDWLRFSEKFSIPGVVGKTASAMGSAQGLAMKDAVTNFGNDYSSVIYGADGSETIELIEANGNPSAMPMPALIEMVNRKFAALYRGADLSTMSSGQGDGAGASLQGDEGEILERDDAASRSEDLQRIEATVLKWYFGEDVEILAEGRIHAPEKEDQAMLLAATKQFVEMGAKLGREEMLARFGLSEALADEATFTSPGRDVPRGHPWPGRPLPETIPAINATLPEAGDIMLTAASELVALARREDTAALQSRLRDVLSEASPQMMQVKLAALNADLPKFLEASPAMDSAWERIYLTAVSEGWAEQPSGKDTE